MHYTNKECDVSPYRDDYAPVRNVPIVQAATAYTSPYTSQTYILIFNEALWMGDTMDYTLVNPNQLRHFGIKVQDDPTSDAPIHIVTEDASFSMELKMCGTIVYNDTHTPSQQELHDCPHIIMSSPHEWDPHNVTFKNHARSFKEEMSQNYNVSTLSRHDVMETCDDNRDVFNIAQINQRIINSVIVSTPTLCNKRNIKATVSKPQVPNKNSPPLPETEMKLEKSLDIGSNDLSLPNVFQSSNRHTDVSAEDLSERWFISVKQAAATLKKTTQKFLPSALLPLSRRYRADRMFHRKTLTGDWATDTIDGRTKSIDGNRYAQVFTSKNYFGA